MPLSNFDLYQRDIYIKSNAEAGVSANETLRQLQSLGLGMQRQAFLNTYRNYSEIPKKAEAVKYTPTKYLIPDELYTPAEGFISTNYRYTIKYDTVNPTTGESFTRYTRISSDTPLTANQVLGEGALITSQENYWEGEEVLQLAIHEMSINPDMLT
jgi:hypothetical protein